MSWDSCRSVTPLCNELHLQPSNSAQNSNFNPKVTSYTDNIPSLGTHRVNDTLNIDNSESEITNVGSIISNDVNLGTTDKLCMSKLNPEAEAFTMRKPPINSSNNVQFSLETSSHSLSNTNDIHEPDPVMENSLSEVNAYNSLKELRVKNLNRVIVAHLNINSIRNKFDMLADLVSGKVDILLISETKIDGSFPTAQFLIPGFSEPYRRDRSRNGGGLLLYVSENIPSRMVHSPCLQNNNESLFVEINLYKKKWIVGGTYNPSKLSTPNHISYLSKCLDTFISYYDNILLLGDFNCEPTDDVMTDFCQSYNLKNLIGYPTCFKNIDNPSCIDLILTNRYRSFQNNVTIETGLSDFHKMTVSVLKTFFRKMPPNIISYRNFSKFSPDDFRRDLQMNVINKDIFNMSNDEFVSLLMENLQKHAPLKHKYVRANNSPFITKNLRKEIMKRSKLLRAYQKDPTDIKQQAYKNQRNICTSLCRKTKRQYYSTLNPSCVTSNKKFWKTVKPLFSEKVLTGESITLVDKQEIIDDSQEVAESFSDFFSNAVKNLNLVQNDYRLDEFAHISDPIFQSIVRYENHPSIIKIKETSCWERTFTFSPISPSTVSKEIASLCDSTVCSKDNIPSKIMKENINLFSVKLSIDINNSIDNSFFPSNLKLADITPAHKKGDKTDKSNYRPVSILPAMSKVFERVMYKQLYIYFEKILSKYQCGFRKNFSSQHCLILMIEKWKRSMDQKACCGAVLTDLSKAFDCLDHDLLIAKLNAHGVALDALKLLQSYLSNRFQRVKVNSCYSSWTEILSGVPQGSILGPLLFNIYLSDLFLFLEGSNIASYADDNTPYACEKDIETVICNLEEDSKILLEWVSNNKLKANPDKFHLILSDNDPELSLTVDTFAITNSNSETLLGVTIDNKLNFNQHVSKLCTKASQKLHALARVSKFMNFERRKMILNAFINSQFGYCPLVWMFHSRHLNKKINNIHERSLRLVYDDTTSTFEELLKHDGSVTIHVRNLQLLATEIFKVVNGTGPEIMKEIFSLKESPRYDSRFPFNSNNIHTEKYGKETLTFLGPKIWSLVPNEIKKSKSILEFKKLIKTWNTDKCPCRLCKNFVADLGFVN